MKGVWHGLTHWVPTPRVPTMSLPPKPAKHAVIVQDGFPYGKSFISKLHFIPKTPFCKTHLIIPYDFNVHDKTLLMHQGRRCPIRCTHTLAMLSDVNDIECYSLMLWSHIRVQEPSTFVSHICVVLRRFCHDGNCWVRLFKQMNGFNDG